MSVDQSVITFGFPSSRLENLTKYFGLKKRAQSKYDTILKGCEELSNVINLQTVQGTKFIIAIGDQESDERRRRGNKVGDIDFTPVVGSWDKIISAISDAAKGHPATDFQGSNSDWEYFINSRPDMALKSLFFGMLPYATLVHEDPDKGLYIIEMKEVDDPDRTDQVLAAFFGDCEDDDMYISVGVLDFPRS